MFTKKGEGWLIINEIQAYYTLGDHPCIAQMLGHDINEDGSLSLHLKKYTGDMWKILESIKPTSLEFLRMMADIMLGLEYIHSKGMAHRDLKPDNVLISLDDNGRITETVLCDLATTCKKELALATNCVTTYMYASPEAYNGEGGDQEDDIWSLAAIIHNIFTSKKYMMNVGNRCNSGFKRGRYALSSCNVPFIEKIFGSTSEYRYFLLKLFNDRPHVSEILNYEMFDPLREHINQRRMIGDCTLIPSHHIYRYKGREPLYAYRRCIMRTLKERKDEIFDSITEKEVHDSLISLLTLSKKHNSPLLTRAIVSLLPLPLIQLREE